MWGLLLALVACRPAPPPPPPSVLERFQCVRCHDGIGGLPLIAEEDHCVRCHQGILAGRYDEGYKPDHVARWKKNLHHLLDVPSLEGLDQRVRREWLVAWLQHPHDLRPQLPAQMPRMPISAADAEAIADALGLRARPVEAPPEGDVERGRALLNERGCVACHDTEVPALAATVPSRERSAGQALALDLRFVHERSTPSQVRAWLTDPRAVAPHTPMPPPVLDESERSDLIAALFAMKTPSPSGALPSPLPLLDREVTWEEVSEQVFRKICWHCHSNPEFGGDGGPGYAGGFGYAGKDLDLSSEEAVLRGSRLPSGERRDLLAAGPEGLSTLGRFMMARHAEVAGQEVPGVLGMPLGLTPIALERIQLVETWAAQRRAAGR